jgi:hypothetical protein
MTIAGGHGGAGTAKEIVAKPGESLAVDAMILEFV